MTGDSSNVRRILELAGLSGRFPVQHGERLSNAPVPGGQVALDQDAGEVQFVEKVH